jgi:hypothetical protein
MPACLEGLRRHLGRRPLGLAALALVAAEALAAAAGASSTALTLLALLLAPGLALAPLLPSRLRDAPVAALAALPAIGFAAAAILLISVSRAGVPLDDVTVRASLAVAVVAAVVLLPPAAVGRSFEPWEAVGLLAAVVAGIVLQNRVIGGAPVPGNDWAKYVLYADEIRRQGALLIDNPFWMLGVPFREDPAVPALYAAHLLLSGDPPAVLIHGIWVFAVMGVLSVFAWVRTVWSAEAAVIACALVAVVPLNQAILGWHGLANVAALALLPLAFLQATEAVRRGLGWREAGGFAVVLVGLAAAHRLTLLVGLAAIALVALAALALPHRQRVVRAGARTAAVGAVLGIAVAGDLLARQRTFGGTQPYTAYLATRVDLATTARAITYPLLVAALIAAVVVLVRPRTRGRELLPVFALVIVVSGLAYAWRVELPLGYLRMPYYLPLALGPLVGVALVTLVPRPPVALGAGAALAAVVGTLAWGQADGVRRFYDFTNAASLRGLDSLARELRPREVVATDRCWSFLGTWLLRTPTLPALDRADIQPQAEVAIARQAQEILQGTPRGLARARRLGVRFVLLDPTCTDDRGRPLLPPPVGRPRFVSERLVVLALPGSG